MQQYAALILYSAAALASGLAAAIVLRFANPARTDRRLAAVAAMLTALWALCVVVFGMDRPPEQVAEIGRNLAWIAVIYRLFANDGRNESVRAVRPLAIALGLVEAIQLFLVAISIGLPSGSEGLAVARETSALLRMLVGIGALVLLHNLIAGAAESSRRLLAWNAGGLALLWGFSLNIHTIAFLTGSVSGELSLMRAVIETVAVVAIAIGYLRASAELRFRPSRSVTFSLVSLGLIAIYLMAMTVLSRWIGGVSGDLGRLTQVAFLLVAIGAGILWLPSQRMRGWMRVVLLKHLFRHRYDYRSEWIAFTSTISCAPDGARPLMQRAVQSLADITDSEAGLLLLAETDGSLAMAADWRWPLAQVPHRAAEPGLVAILEREQLIVDFDEARRGIEHHGELAHIPAWLIEETRAWAAVPLLHHDRLVGLAILARPRTARRLDWEDFDLLEIAGRQVGSYLAEQSGQEALVESARFEEFNRRMAFVMHDIKNLSSQIGLLLRNAEKHVDKPEFQRDMLVTLRSSSDKLDGLISRLGRYGAPGGKTTEEIDLNELARELKARFAVQHPVEAICPAPCRVLGDRQALDQALQHLIQNAIDASAAASPVLVATSCDGIRGQIEIIDTGAGMSTDFLRRELFRPFVSSKPGGFGIGAGEARDLIRAMGGRLDVVSREGIGTRFTASFPSADAARIIARRAGEAA